MKCAFFAALWTKNPLVIEDFFIGLRRWCDISGVALMDKFEFEKIGEVKFLRRRLATLRKGAISSITNEDASIQTDEH